jgi:hypothetical protein
MKGSGNAETAAESGDSVVLVMISSDAYNKAMRQYFFFCQM